MDLRTWLVIATVAGFLITVGGLVAAYVGAQREYRQAGVRLDKMRELGDAEQAESARLNEIHEAQKPRTLDEQIAHNKAKAVADQERHAHWDAAYEKWELVRPTYDNMVELAAYESKRLLGLVLNSTRRDFLVAAFGLLVSTAASVGSLYLVS